MKKVIVLLSSYNGEKYIAEQIDSILNQTYQNIEIHVRDDGSKDNTLKVLEPYVERGQVQLDAGTNLGFAQSFFALIRDAGEADFYAFADQDDVWMPDKIERAVATMEKARTDIPVLYYTNFDFHDGDMNFVSHRDVEPPKTSFLNSLVDCVPLGFNTMFNQKARQMTLEHYPVKSTGHDWWMYMLCSALGELIYDPKPSVRYRRHAANTSGESVSFLKFQIWRFKRFFVNGYFEKIHDQIKEFDAFFGDQLSAEDKKVIDVFAADGKHLKKAFYPKKLRQKGIDELFLRFVLLIGKM